MGQASAESHRKGPQNMRVSWEGAQVARWQSWGLPRGGADRGSSLGTVWEVMSVSMDKQIPRAKLKETEWGGS